MGSNIKARDISVEERSLIAVSRTKYQLTVATLVRAGLDVIDTCHIKFKDNNERRLFQPTANQAGSYCASGESIAVVVYKEAENGVIPGIDSYVLPNSWEHVEALEKLGFVPNELPVPLSSPEIGQFKNKVYESDWRKGVEEANKSLVLSKKERPDTFSRLHPQKQNFGALSGRY